MNKKDPLTDKFDILFLSGLAINKWTQKLASLSAHHNSQWISDEIAQPDTVNYKDIYNVLLTVLAVHHFFLMWGKVLFTRPFFSSKIYLFFNKIGMVTHLFIPIFTNPSTRAGYDTRSIFKWSLTGMSSEFSFS